MLLLDWIARWKSSLFASKSANLSLQRRRTSRRLGSAAIQSLEHRVMLAATPIGVETQVNTSTTGDQETAGARSVATDDAGNSVVVWTSVGQDGSAAGTYAQRFNASGTPIGTEFRVNQSTFGNQIGAVVTMNSQGSFVVAWASEGQDGSGYGVYMRRYDSAGNALGNETRVNTYAIGNQFEVSAAMNDSGNVVIIWTSNGQDGSGDGIYGQRYSSTGSAVGSEFRVNTPTVGQQSTSAVTMNSLGEFMVTWHSANSDGSGFGVFSQRYTSTGARSGSNTLVNTTTAGDQFSPEVATNSSGDYIITCLSTGAATGIFAQRYTSTGAKIGSEFRIDTPELPAATIFVPSIAMRDDGSFFAVWTTSNSSNGLEVVGRDFFADGTPFDVAEVLNTNLVSDQWGPTVAVDASGNSIVAWTSFLQDGSGDGVFMQRFGLPTQSNNDFTIPENSPANTFVGEVSVDSGTSPFTYFFTAGNEAGAFTINSSTGVITVANPAPLDFETQPIFTLTVAVVDANNQTQFQTVVARLTDVNESGSNTPPTVTLTNTVTTLPQTTDTTNPVRVADISISDDGLGTNELSLVGLDADLFQIIGSQLFLRAGTTLSSQSNSRLDVTVQVDDTTVGTTPDSTAGLTILVTGGTQNIPPVVSLSNAAVSISENTSTANRVFVADIVVNDDGVGTNDVFLAGTDAASFEIIGSQLFLRAGTTLDATSKPTFFVTVNVDDPSLGGSPDDTVAYQLQITEVSNTAPTITLANAVVSLPETTDTTNRIKLGDILISDDGLGSNQLFLTGTNAGVFEIIGTQLFLRAGTTLNRQSNPQFLVTINVDDTSVGGTPDDTIAYQLNITAAQNTAPTLTLANAVVSLPENTNTSSPIKLADIVINDDGLGSNQTFLTGSNAGFFQIVGTELFLRAGVTLNRASNPTLFVTVNVDDPSLGGSPDDTVNYQLNITSAQNTPPTMQLANATVFLPENTDTTFNIKVADIVINDDGLGNNQLTLLGPDAGLFFVSGSELFLRAGTDLNRSANPSLDVTLTLDDPSVGSTPDASINYSINVTSSTNSSPTISGFDDSTTFSQGGQPVQVGQNATVSDDDSSDFDNGSMAVQFTDYRNTNDQLGVKSGSSGASAFATSAASSPITTSGNQVLWNGTVIGTYSGGAGGNPLTFQFNANANAQNVQDLIRALTYANSSSSPTTAGRAVQLTLSDGDGGSSSSTRTTVSKTVNVSSTSTGPVIGGMGTAPTFTEGLAPMLFASQATITDRDSTDFDTGRMTFTTLTNGQPEDVMSIRNQGFGAGQVGTLGSTLYYNGAAIGSFQGGENGTPLEIRFNGQADAPAAQAVLRNVMFSNTSGNPSSLTRNIQVSMTDGHGGTGSVSRGMIVKPVNTPPEIVITQNSVDYTENATSTVIDDQFEVSDVDSINFSGGKLTMTMTSPTSGATVADRIQVNNQGTGVGQIGLSGTNVLYGGMSIGTFSGGNGTTPMTVSFNAQATPEAVQALMRNMMFSTAGENPSGAARSMNIMLTDGDGGTSLVGTKTVNVTPVNDAPTIGGFTTAATYRKGGTPIAIGTNSTVGDFDSTNFDGGTMTLMLSQNGESTDRLTIQNQGRFAGQIGVSGQNVTYGGSVIGTFTGGQGLTSLEIHFNSAATPAAVQALLRMIMFSSAGTNPSGLARTLDVTVSDGDGETSVIGTKQINVMLAAPVIAGWDTVATFTENGAPTILDTNATVTDADSPRLAGGLLTVETTANGTAEDILGVKNQGTGVSQIGVNGSVVTYGGVAIGTMSGGTGSPLAIQLNASATPISVQALVRSLTFSNSSNSPSTAQRTVQLTLTDDDGRVSTAVSKKVTVVAVNDGPVIDGMGGTTSTWQRGGGPINIGLGSLVTDTDSPDFNQGRLTVRFFQNGTSTDRLLIENQGSGAGQIGVVGSNITYGGTVIGSFSGGTSTAPLSILFNAKATAAGVSTLLNALQYDSTSATTTTRSLQVTLTDGDGGTSPGYFTNVAVS
jgi:hypothetical protein